MALVGWSPDGAPRRLRRAVKQVESAFGGTPRTGKALDRAVNAYGQAMTEALDRDTDLALRLFRGYDARIPPDRYRAAFDLGVHVRLSELIGRQGDADLLVAALTRWQGSGLLGPDQVTAALRGHLSQTLLERDAALWSSFFAHFPEALVPELFEVRCLLGQGADAVRLADTPARKLAALDCCLRSPRLRDVEEGLALAHALGEVETIAALEAHAGDLRLSGGDFAGALAHFEKAGRADRASECYERLGRVAEALDTCPGEDPDRLARLAGMCRADVDALVEQGHTTDAVRRARELIGHLDRAAEATDPLTAVRDELDGKRRAAVAMGRRDFDGRLRAAGEDGRELVHREWSRFEEDAGEPAEAARQAEEGGDLYRAHRLYRAAERFGDADRVLKNDGTSDGRAARAAAREAGGDLPGAARLHEQAGRDEEALALYARAGEYDLAARCLLRWKGDEAIEDPRLADFLRRAGDLEELVRRSLDAIERKGRATRAVEELRSGTGGLPPALAARVDDALAAVGAAGRGPFEERAAAWVAQARSEVDQRFARIWGFDLGTTTCAAAIYDSETGQPVLCPDAGRPQFASTLTLDDDGNEIVGLTGDQILASWVRGHISAAKRRMGTRSVFRIGKRTYRPEEVAARLVRHARDLVEGMLAERVRERVGELAHAELGMVRDEWLEWAADHHDLRLERPRAILTIPAYFLNNQKHATRHACEIAGVRPVRLIHEPTAACMAVARERKLTGRIAVVDLGAGTLDVSVLELEDNVYDVQQVVGDNHYGGSDFDAVISKALAARLRGEGVDVPDTGTPRRRLEVAAEYLKIALSSQEHADYPLVRFTGDLDVRLELDRSELAGMLQQPLRRLRQVCGRVKDSLNLRPKHLVLVGGPMLSPLVNGVVEEVFGLKRTVMSDPRTAVARGAALQAAVLDGKLKEQLLLDVTPFALGIRVVDDEDMERFSELIAANTAIPVQRKDTYTTHHDNQTAIRIEIFNGGLEQRAKIGQFLLDGLPPANRNEPVIDVTFSIDASCVLEVTARDRATGNSKSVRVSDTTLLSPREIQEMARRQRRQLEAEELRAELNELAQEAMDTDDEPLWREFRDRLGAHRRPHGLDAGTDRLLGELFNQSPGLEADMSSLRAPLRDLAAKAQEYLRLATPADASEALAEGSHLANGLREHLERMRAGTAKVAQWNRVLAGVAAAETNPLHRFRNLHDAGDYVGALRSLSGLPEPLEERRDLYRWLTCLAETGDVDGYGTALKAQAGRLGITAWDPAEPGAFLTHLRSALVTVRTADNAPTGSGFLISDQLVVTNRHWLARAGKTAEAGHLDVVLESGTRTVRHIFLPDSAGMDAAVLLLGEPVPAEPLRLGYSKLVRIGDVARAPEAPQVLLPGIIDKFESFPEQGLRLFKTGMHLPPQCSGGPLLNELGEVIGLLTLRDPSQPAYAVTVDSLAPLLAGAGFGVTGEDGR